MNMQTHVYGDYPFLTDYCEDSDVKRRLSLFLDSLVRGNNQVYVTPIAKRSTPDEIFKSWDALFQEHLHLMNDNEGSLLELEERQRSKMGPRSIAVSWAKRKQTLNDYFEIQESSDLENCTLDPVLIKYKSRLRPLTFDKALKYLKNDTNSGLPYFKKKGIIKSKMDQELYLRLLTLESPCILFTRTQEQRKTRNVWGFPIAETLREMMYYIPILEVCKALPYRSALLGPEIVDVEMTKKLKQSAELGRVNVCTDIDLFDQRCGPNKAKSSFNKFKILFQTNFHSEIDLVNRKFSNIGIVTPDGIIEGPHGTPSGSVFTNEIGSDIHYEAAMDTGCIVRELTEVQGDDMYASVNEDDVDVYLNGLEMKGLLLNRPKCYTSKVSAVYLQKLYHPHYIKDDLIGGIYPLYRALNRIIFQERWSDFEDYGLNGKDYYAIRTICILENCKYHPLFEVFVKFIADLQKYSLLPSEDSITKYVRMISDSSGISDVIINQFGDNVKGIRSFATYKLIMNQGY